MGVEEREEAALEEARRDGLAAVVVLLEDARDRGGPSALLMPRDQASREVGLVRRRTSASSNAAFRCWGGTTAARSRSVRAGVVTGMPSCTVTSSGCISTTCTSMRAVLRRCRGTLTSTRARDP
jgi:hypothetical protein